MTAGMGNRDRVREAIQRLSPDIERRHVYEHSGLAQPAGAWLVLSPRGRRDRRRGRGVRRRRVAPRAASRILVPGADQRRRAAGAAFRAELALLELAPDAITVPLLGAVYRALLCAIVPADVSLFLVGPTGVFKSELAACAMQHFGAGFDRLHLPANWSATANYLERVAFDFKDALLVVDDFAPSGTQHDVARLARHGRTRVSGSRQPRRPWPHERR